MKQYKIVKKYFKRFNKIDSSIYIYRRYMVFFWKEIYAEEIAFTKEGEKVGFIKFPKSMEEVELADTIIRICDYAGYKGYDMSGAIQEKLEFNRNREDHKIENRLKENGKKV